MIGANPHRSPYRFLQHTLLAAACFLAATSVSPADDAPTVEQIATAVRDWREQLLPLRLQYKVTFPSKADGAISPQWMRSEWLFAFRADYHFYRFTTDEYDVDQLTRRKVESGTSEERFTIKYDVSGTEPVATQATAMPRVNRNILPTPVTPIYMQFLAAKAVWLDEQLSKGTAEVSGVEELDGSPCVVVFVPHYAEDDARNGAGDRVWFDREHLALIRRVRPVKAGGYVGFEYDCTKFAEVRPGLLFPNQGTFGNFDHGSGMYWQVETVEAGTSIDPASFRPPPEVKTTGVRFVQRPEPNIDLQQSVAASREPSRFRFWMLGLLGVLALLAAGIVSRRSGAP